MALLKTRAMGTKSEMELTSFSGQVKELPCATVILKGPKVQITVG
jgi:hypothetical protein